MDKETARRKNTRGLQLHSQTSDFSSLRAVVCIINSSHCHKKISTRLPPLFLSRIFCIVYVKGFFFFFFLKTASASVNKTRRHTRLTDIKTVDGKRILGTLNLKSLSLPSLLRLCFSFFLFLPSFGNKVTFFVHIFYWKQKT